MLRYASNQLYEGDKVIIKLSPYHKLPLDLDGHYFNAEVVHVTTRYSWVELELNRYICTIDNHRIYKPT